MNTMIIILLYLAFGTLVALLAKRKGLNVFFWFLFGMVLFPFALIGVFFAKDRTGKGTPAAGTGAGGPAPSSGSGSDGRGEEDLEGLVRAMNGLLDSTGPGTDPSSYMPPEEEPFYTDPIEEQIDSYHELYKAGILTREEFEEKRAALLASRG